MKISESSIDLENLQEPVSIIKYNYVYLSLNKPFDRVPIFMCAAKQKEMGLVN